MNVSRATACALLCLVCVEPSVAKLLRVPAHHPAIQTAINAAAAGDTVLVSDGVYFEHLNFNGKAITVASEVLLTNDTSHIAATIVDGSQPGSGDTGSVVIFCNGETSSSQLCGFTLRGGDGTPVNSWQWGDFGGGGGILVTHGSPTVTQCHIHGNSDDVLVIESDGYAALQLDGCTIDGTITAMEGGTVATEDCVIAWVNCLADGNATVHSCHITGGVDLEQAYGSFFTSVLDGQLYCYRSSAGVDSSTVARTTVFMDGAISLTNCFITGSVDAEGENGGAWLEGSTVLGGISWMVKGVGTLEIKRCAVLGQMAYATYSYYAQCNVYESLPAQGSHASVIDTANVYREAITFCNRANNDYHVSENSKCAPANNPCGTLIGVFSVGCSCCSGTRGNVDTFAGVDLSDLSLLIAYLTVSPAPHLPCNSAANIDGAGIVDLSDLTALTGFLTGAGGSLSRCPSGIS